MMNDELMIYRYQKEFYWVVLTQQFCVYYILHWSLLGRPHRGASRPSTDINNNNNYRYQKYRYRIDFEKVVL